jgi:hypothetical protein
MPSLCRSPKLGVIGIGGSLRLHPCHIHGRPRFARQSYTIGRRIEIAAIHPDC